MEHPCRSHFADRATALETAVANFFTPASQKPKDRTTWTERSPDEAAPATLLVAKYVPERGEEGPPSKRRKIAAFDLVRAIAALIPVESED
jgi:bifunctional polynucleotide phosphatase/kinase